MKTTILHLLLPLLCLFTTHSAQAQRTATAVPTLINGFVVSITVTDGGAGYTTPPSVTVSGGSGSGATATATVLNGVVDKVIVGNAGTGYTGSPVVTIAAPPSPKPPFSDGLVAYYPFSGNANDESGTGNHGVVHGATLAPDRFGTAGSAYSFNGTTSYIGIPDSPSLNPPSAVSVSTWIKTVEARAGCGIVSKFAADGSATGQWVLEEVNSPDSLGVFRPGFTAHAVFGAAHPQSELRVDFATPQVDGSWHQLMMTYDGAVLTLYKDGKAVVSKSGGVGTLAVYPQPVEIGRYYGEITRPGLNFYYSGFIDDVRIYNRALSDQEVKDLYRYESPEQPWLSIAVQTVEVTMHVKPTKKYQLESSSDLKSWSKVGDVILAGSSEIPLTLNVLQVGQFFRVYEVQ